MKKTILIFGLLVLALLLLFRLSEYALISGDLGTETVIAVVAIVFFAIGVFMNRKENQGKDRSTREIDRAKINELGLSKREMEVLHEIAMGHSNHEIAEKLFVSESTIKTHVSNLLVKLNAKRRTQAVQLAKELRII